MKKNSKKLTRTSVILFALCALIWTARVVVDIIYGNYSDTFLFIMNILCAFVWIVCFIVNLRRYRAMKDEQDT